MLREQFNTDLKEAMKAQDTHKLATIRLILAALKEKDIMARSEANYTETTDSDIIALLHKMIKQRQQSIQMYKDANRPELAKQEQDEIDIIQAYLPEPLTEDELKSEIAHVISEIDASGMKDMKRVIEALKDKCGDRVDFGKASPLIRDQLST